MVRTRWISRLTMWVCAILCVTTLGLSSGVHAQTTKISFTAWADSYQAQVYEQLARAFNAQNPHIEVEFVQSPGVYWDNLIVNVAAGVGPDVYLTQEMLSVGFIKDGYFLPLNDYMARDKDYEDIVFFEGLFDPFTWDGAIGALPLMTYSSILYWNKQIAGEAGVAVPDTITWDEVIDTARKMTERDLDGAPVRYGYRFETQPNFYLHYLWQNGGGIISEDRRQSLFGTQASIEAIEYLTDLIWTYGVSPKPDEIHDFWFESNRLGVWNSGNWSIDYFYALGMDIDVTPVATKDGNPTTMAYPNGLAISATSQHPDAAWEFIKFAAGEVGQAIIAEGGLGIPANFEVAVSPDYISGPTAELRKRSVEGLMTARGPRVVPGLESDIFNYIIAPELEPVWHGMMSFTTIAEEVDRQIQRYLDEVVWAE